MTDDQLIQRLANLWIDGSDNPADCGGIGELLERQILSIIKENEEAGDPAEDNRLDDPRHGQAEYINRGM